jgi:hypothetical protein
MEERAELDLAVADDARHRRPTGFVLTREVLDHRLIELALGIEQVVGDAEAARHLAGVVHALGRAAAPELGGTAFGLTPGPHTQGHADHFDALLDEKGGRHGRVHPSAHADDDPLVHGIHSTRSRDLESPDAGIDLT